MNLESVMWPRAAALAEVFWTGAGDGKYPRSKLILTSGDITLMIGSVEAYPRMHDIRYRMVDRGVRAEPLQPHWCALRPGKLPL
jgi:hexosaminidase